MVAVAVPIAVVVVAVLGGWNAWWVPAAIVLLGLLSLRQVAWAATAVELDDADRLRLARPVGTKQVDVGEVLWVRRSLISGGRQVLIITGSGSVPLSLGLTNGREIAATLQTRNPHVKINL